MEYWEWKGRRYEAVDPDDWSIRTLREVERHLGYAFAASSGGDRYLALAFGVIHRADPDVQWVELEAELTGKDVGRLALAMDANRNATQADAEPERRPQAVEVTGTVHLPVAVSDGSGPQPAQAPVDVVLSPTSAGSVP